MDNDNCWKVLFFVGIAIGSVVFIGVAWYLFLWFTKKEPQTTHNNNKPLKAREIAQQKVVKEKVENTTQNEKVKEVKKVIEVKDITKVKKVEEIPYITYDLGFIESSNVFNSNKQSIKKPIKKVTKDKIEKEKKVSKENTKVNLQTQALTLQVAIGNIKNYYKIGDYQNAIKWCKIASRIDNTNEDVWVYYALSLYKTGQKDKAKEVLNTYLKYKDSKRVRNILKRLKWWKNYYFYFLYFYLDLIFKKSF